MRVAGIVCLVVACSGPARPPAPTPAPIAETAPAIPPRWDGTECPPPEAVTLAVPDTTGWVLEVGFVSNDQEERPEGPLVASQLAAFDLAPLPERTWIYRPGEPPCRGTIERYESTLINEDLNGDRDTTGYEVTAFVSGCAPSEGLAWAVAGPEELASTCTVVGATTRENDPLDDDLKISRPVQPVPKPYDALVPRLDCRRDCVTDWTIEEVATSPTVARVKLSRVDVDQREDVCSWDNETRFGTFVNLHEVVDAPMMSLQGAFALDGAPRLLLYIGSGAFAVAALDGERLGRVERTFFDDVEIGECGEWQCCCGC